MWYTNYYDYPEYLHEMHDYVDGWVTHPIPLSLHPSTSRAPQRKMPKEKTKTTGMLRGLPVPFEILPPLPKDWRGTHRLVSVSQGDGYSMGVCSCGKVFIEGFIRGRDYEFKSELVNWENIISLSAGPWGILGLRKDGTVIYAGYLSGEGRKKLSRWRNIVQVSASEPCLVGLRKDGTVLVDDDLMQEAVSSWRDIVQVSAGDGYLMGVRRDGTVALVEEGGTYGNGFGHDVSGWTDIVQVSAGPWHAAGLRRDGTVVVAVSDQYYEHLDDVQCLDVGDWTDIVQVCAGNQLTAGRSKNGAILVAINGVGSSYDNYPREGYTAHLGVRATDISASRHTSFDEYEVLMLDENGRASTWLEDRVFDWNNWKD